MKVGTFLLIAGGIAAIGFIGHRALGEKSPLAALFAQKSAGDALPDDAPE